MLTRLAGFSEFYFRRFERGKVDGWAALFVKISLSQLFKHRNCVGLLSGQCGWVGMSVLTPSIRIASVIAGANVSVTDTSHISFAHVAPVQLLFWRHQTSLWVDAGNNAHPQRLFNHLLPARWAMSCLLPRHVNVDLLQA